MPLTELNSTHRRAHERTW